MSFVRRASGALLATGLAATMGMGSYWSAQTLQSTLVDQARKTLESRSLVATVQFDGRDATVWAATPAAREQAIAALLTIPGVRVVVPGDGTAPENATAGSTVTVTHATPGKASATTSYSPSATASPTTTSTVTASATISSTPSASSTPTASASSLTATATPTPTPTKLAIPAWGAIQFEGGTSTLDATDKAELVQIAQFMVANPIVKVALTGHTDMGRTDAERQALGLARAKAAAGVPPRERCGLGPHHHIVQGRQRPGREQLHRRRPRSQPSRDRRHEPGELMLDGLQYVIAQIAVIVAVAAILAGILGWLVGRASGKRRAAKALASTQVSRLQPAPAAPARSLTPVPVDAPPGPVIAETADYGAYAPAALGAEPFAMVAPPSRHACNRPARALSDPRTGNPHRTR